MCFKRKKPDRVAGRRYIEEELPHNRDILKEAQFQSHQEKTKAARETRKTKKKMAQERPGPEIGQTKTTLVLSNSRARKENSFQ